MINPKPFDSDELYDDCNSDPKQVKCFCGEVAFTVFNGRVRMARECACNDCYQHMKWCRAVGGPDVPPIPHGGYWDNDIQLDRGEENLMVVMLRESGRSRRLVAKCCHSTLLIDHPSYKGIQFLLFENACKIPWDNDLDPPTVTRLPSDRIFMKDWDGSRGELPEFIGDPERVVERAGLPFTHKTNRQNIDNPLGETCQSLFSRLPWFTLEIEEGLIPTDRSGWPNLKPIEVRHSS